MYINPCNKIGIYNNNKTKDKNRNSIDKLGSPSKFEGSIASFTATTPIMGAIVGYGMCSGKIKSPQFLTDIREDVKNYNEKNFLLNEQEKLESKQRQSEKKANNNKSAISKNNS